MNDYITALEAMSRVFDTTASPMDAFNKKNYKGGFEQVYHKLVPAFDAIETLYKTVGDPQQMLDNMAGAIVTQANGILAGCKRNSQKQTMMMNLNMQLACFVYPSILSYKGESSQPLTDAIAAKWKEAFPKTNVTPASFEMIEKGFHRKFCYITTAVCSSRDLPDDCYELTLLRDYRDGYMSSLEEGAALIRSYYDIAPTIVKHIDRLPGSDEVYNGIWTTYIRPCISLIEEGRNQECLDLYVRMVSDLKETYFYQ